MRKVKTHTFDKKTFTVCEVTRISGICDLGSQELMVLDGDSIEALGSALEEGCHALKIPDKYLHKPDSQVKKGQSASKIDDLARFLWRLGWRRVK
jgi:hypothetical protein